MRRCTQLSPICKHSSHPWALGVTSWIWFVCVHRVAMLVISRNLAIRRLIDRQAHAEARSPRLGGDADLPVMPPHDDTAGGVEPQAAAFADPLGGEERLPDAGL